MKTDLSHSPSKPLTYRSVGKIETIVSYLEMKAEPLNCSYPNAIDGLEIARVTEPTIPFYRFLYDQVGSTWNWTGRKLLSDAQLGEKIWSPQVEIFVLYAQGSPAGYLELELQNDGKEIEIVYFGLIPDYFGRGFGRYMMRWINWYVWKQKRPRRLWVHTCTLDGEQALPTYLKSGFVKYDEKTELVDVIKAVIAAK